MGLVICLVSAITIIGYFLVIPVMVWGISLFMLNIYDGKAAFNDVFAGFKDYGKTLGRMLVLILIMVAIGLVSNIVTYVGIFTRDDDLQLTGTYINLIITFTVTLRLYFGPFFMVDQDMAAVDSLKASWNATKGLTLKCIGLAIASGILAMMGLIAFVIGVFFTFMAAQMMYVSAYRQMVGPAATVADN